MIRGLRRRLALRQRWRAARTAVAAPSRPRRSMEDMAITPEQARHLAESRSDPTAGGLSPLEEILYAGEGRLVHKWLHFPQVYERYLARYRGTPVRMLEIGVFQGGSLEMWRSYLGAEATIHGLDLDPACAERVTPPNRVHIGSQDDPELLRRVVAEMGGLDVVLDDGSHIGRHQWVSFAVLFPLLAEGGLYLIEDLHTSYWPGHEGGIGSKTSGIGLVEAVIQDMHGWYHDAPERTMAREWVHAVHVHDSVVVFEKGRVSPPRHVQVPGSAV